MKIEILPASKGDCFIVTWKESKDEFSILIDTGIKGTYKHIKNKLKGEKNLKGIFITHVDYDHIGGMLKMIADKHCPVDMKEVVVYINTPELIIGTSEDDKVHYGHGTSLETSLNNHEVKKEPVYKNLLDDNILKIGGLKLTILSPTFEVLTELKSNWTKEDIYEKYLEESKTEGKVSTDEVNLQPYDKIIEEEEQFHSWKEDLINSSSIAFILQANDKKVLFLGDSNPILIQESLNELGFDAKNKLHVDFVKVSHHGSKHNTSKKLLECIKCENYLISTNGRGPYYHPHRETIIRISEYSRDSKDMPLNIYTNYKYAVDKLLTKSEQEMLNINIEEKNEFILS